LGGRVIDYVLMEVELQYIYAATTPPTVPIELAHLTLAGSETVGIVDTYFDTEELTLRRAGCSLRTRIADNYPSPRLTWKGPSKRSRRHNGKKRAETEFPLDSIPETGTELLLVLQRHRLWEQICDSAEIDAEPALHPIGQLRNHRSTHTYVHGLHRLELSWDRLEFPVGPDQIRLELELKSDHTELYLEQADAELRRLFGDDLVPAERGKVRELCDRLYPELAAA
jgi:inorganic triphosphatase YgiF